MKKQILALTLAAFAFTALALSANHIAAQTASPAFFAALRAEAADEAAQPSRAAWKHKAKIAACVLLALAAAGAGVYYGPDVWAAVYAMTPMATATAAADAGAAAGGAGVAATGALANITGALANATGTGALAAADAGAAAGGAGVAATGALANITGALANATGTGALAGGAAANVTVAGAGGVVAEVAANVTVAGANATGTGALAAAVNNPGFFKVFATGFKEFAIGANEAVRRCFGPIRHILG